MTYEWITDEIFDAKLNEIIDRNKASNLMTIPDIYEILAEHFNNDILSELENEKETTKPKVDKPDQLDDYIALAKSRLKGK